MTGPMLIFQNGTLQTKFAQMMTPPESRQATQEALGRLPLRQLLCCHHLLQKSFLHPKTHTKKGQRRNAWTVSQSVVHDLVSIEWELRDGSDEPAAEMHQNQEVFDATKKKHQ